MKKTGYMMKLLILMILAVVLIVLAVGSPTFSWFERPKSATGKALEYGIAAADNITAYDGSSVEMKTFVSTDDGISFSTVAADPATSNTLAPGSRVYYKTELTNKNTTKEQNVSLYIRNLETGSSGSCCVGTNVPVKSFKNYSEYNVHIPDATKVLKSAKSTKRVYFKAGDNNNTYDNQSTGWNGGNYNVCSVDTSASGHNINDKNNMIGKTYSPLNKIGNGSNGSSVYWAEIPVEDEELFICVGAAEEYWDGTDYKRTQTFTNLTGTGLTQTQSLYFELNSSYTGYRNAYSSVTKCTGANIAKYYGEIELAKTNTQTQTVNIGLTQNVHYSGKEVNGATITYSTDAPSVFTVDADGVITAVGEGEGHLTYSVTSQYGETATQTALVTVSHFTGSQTINAAPIVTNLTIPPATTTNVDNHLNVQVVYWFIQNGDDMYKNDGDLTYSHDGIYLGV